jgi:NAD(P)-dependent dehydrogenase (short-subunit alcohol dehydrogenase family)
MTSDVRFDGRVALVTGAGRGLGREYALLLAQRGAAVAVNDIGVSADAQRYGGDASASNPAADVVAEIKESGGIAIAVPCDITDSAAVAEMVAKVVTSVGRVDVLINNAGIIKTGPFETLAVEDLASCFDVHVRGTYGVAQAVWPHMRSAGYGRILNTCSVEGMLFGGSGMAAYDAAKGAVAGITRAFATEGREHGIQVNGLLPGARTRGNASTSAANKPSQHVDMSPALVAPAVCWLVHEECPTTGSFFAVSSGRVGRVVTGVARGYQELPQGFTLEAVRAHWEQATSIEGVVPITSAVEYNAFRTASFDEALARGAQAR